MWKADVKYGMDEMEIVMSIFAFQEVFFSAEEIYVTKTESVHNCEANSSKYM